MKKLIIFEDSSKVTFGGGQKGTIELIETLKNEYEIILFDCTKNSIFQEKIKKYMLKQYYLKCYGKTVTGEKSSFSIGYLEVILFPFFIIYNLSILVKFIFKNKKKKLVFYTANKKHLIILFLLKKLLRIKYIFHARTYDDKKSFFYKVLKFPLKNAEKIICVSNFIKKHINYSNCITIDNSLFITDKYKQFHISKKLNKNNIIKIATLSELLEWKGIDYFIKSFEYIKFYKIKFFIYGEGKERKKLEILAKNNSNIIFQGYNKNIFDVMANNHIDIIVSASISPESFGRTTIEGCYFGIVPISSNIGAQEELISKIDKNLLFKSKNPKTLAQSIQYAIKHYERLSKKCINFSDNFNFDKFRNQIIDLFKGI